MAENMIPEGILNERRDRLRVLADEGEAEAKRLQGLHGGQPLTQDELIAKIEHQSEAAAYREAYYIMGVGMPQPTAIYPVWFTQEQAQVLIGWFENYEPDFMSTVEEENKNFNTLKAIVTKLKGAAGSKGTEDVVYQASRKALDR